MSDDDHGAAGEWHEGCDFALTQLCRVLGVDPLAVQWDAATETVDGDVRALIGNIFRKCFGDDWAPPGEATAAVAGAPHPRWKPGDGYSRHPQSVEEWDCRNDPFGAALERSRRRLNVAADYDDPRAPDQMALVLRADIGRLSRDWVHKNAVFELWRARDPIAGMLLGDAEARQRVVNLDGSPRRETHDDLAGGRDDQRGQD